MSNWKTCSVIVLCLTAVAGRAGWSRGDQPQGDLSAQQAIESGRRALHGSTRFPWYDRESDKLRRIDISPPPDLQNRKSKWQQRSQKQRASSSRLGDTFWLVVEILCWTLLGLLLAALVGFLIRAYLKGESRQVTQAVSARQLTSTSADRVEHLPFQVPTPQGDLLSETRRHYERGDFRQAIIYLYSYQLLELDKYQVIHLAKGKTNREYLREVRPRAGLHGLLKRTMIAFEDVFFGGQSLDRRQFEACWSQLDEFHDQLEQTAA